MSLMSNKAVLRLRRVMRALGLPKLLARLGTSYESALSQRLVSACRPGDVIWDVGANVGHYSVSFSDWVGPRGRVFAFEPSPVNLSRLRAACQGRTNIEIREFGLSDKAGPAIFLEGSDSLNTTSRVLAPGDAPARQTTQVELRAGAEIIDSGDADLPNVLKIDVEGHELSVLEGLSAVLSDRQLRDIFVEVHFGILDSSGRSEDPKLIEKLLKGKGFKLNWTDASHIHAFRAA
jgi:FkbM family methyltransferase